MNGLPVVGNHWYIPGRTRDVVGDFEMSEAEFYSISRLVPLVATMTTREGRPPRFGVACLNKGDCQAVFLMLAAIRGTVSFKKPETEE